MRYTKPHITYEKQLELLISRGLIVDDSVKADAIHALRTIGYYRLSAYMLPFQKIRDTFNSGTTFEKVISLYRFDSSLRTLLFDALEPIEIAMRTAIIYYLAEKYGPFGYVNAENFANGFRHSSWLAGLEEELSRSHETFVKHYKTKYTESPHFPIWMACEVMSFGSVSKLFRGLRYSDKKKISRAFDVPPDILQSWMHSFVYIRNTCAHHSRIWNRELSIRPKIPGNRKVLRNINNKRIYCAIAILHYSFRKLNIDFNIKGKISKLFELHPSVNIHAMGFDTNWRESALWKDK